MKLVTQDWHRLRHLGMRTGVEDGLGMELKSVGTLSSPGRVVLSSPTLYLYFRLNRLKCTLSRLSFFSFGKQPNLPFCKPLDGNFVV